MTPTPTPVVTPHPPAPTRGPGLVGGCAILLLLALYALTWSRVNQVDALHYFENIRRGDLAALIHPHHLVFELVQAGWVAAWNAVGLPDSIETATKTLSFLGSLLALLVFGATVRRHFGGRVGLLLLLLFGTTYGTWHMATEAEPPIWFLLFSAWNLALLAGLLKRPLTPRDGLVLGLVNSAGMLFHQELVLTVPFTLAVMWIRGGGAVRWRALGLYAVTGIVCVAIPYVLLGLRAAEAQGEPGLLPWLTAYSHRFEGEYGRFHPDTLRYAVQGFLGTWLGGSALKPYLAAGAPRDAGFLRAAAPFLLLAVGLGFLLVRSLWASVSKAQRSTFWMLALWTLVYGGAAVWWMPENRSFWIPVLPSLVLLMGYGMVTDRRGPGRGPLAVAVGLIGVLVAGNLSGGILTKHQHQDRMQPLHVGLDPIITARDFLVITHDRVWLVVQHHRPEYPARGLFVGGRLGRDEDWLAAAAEALVVLRQGGRVFVDDTLADPLLDRMREQGFDPATEPLQVTDLFGFGDSERADDRRRLLAWSLD